MQVLKKSLTLVILLVLASCKSIIVPIDQVGKMETPEVSSSVFSADAFRVAVLLPLSGDAQKHGEGLKNAALMAYEDMNNPNLILQFYDTKGTPEGARVAAEMAISQKAKMIVGPLKSSSVSAISNQVRGRGVPVVAFSTDSSVLQREIYSLGLLVDEQVGRIISYVVAQGRSNFALLLPDNATGISVAKAAILSANASGAKVTRIAFYPPNSTDFSEILRKLTSYDGKSPHVDFDAVLIPESGAKLKSAMAMFAYYDVFSPQVKFFGTSVWENTSLSKESTLRQSWYPALSRNHTAYFNKKYNSLYGQYPNSIYAFAYDAVALSSVLAKKNPQDINAAITNPDGFVGINGVFRLLENGKNEHSLDILEISNNGDVVIDLAPKKFYNLPNLYSMSNVSLYDIQPPLIFGKDAAVAQREIFGRQLGY